MVLFQPWGFRISPKCSWFFRSLCKTLDSIKSHLRIKVVNRNFTSVLEDPWIFEMPINFKPTFVNMSFIGDNLHLNDFIQPDNWNSTHVQQFLSEHISFVSMNLGHIDSSSQNFQVWSSNNCRSIVVSEVYIYLNKSNAKGSPWKGWKNLWRLKTTPRAKFFFFLGFFFMGGSKLWDFFMI